MYGKSMHLKQKLAGYGARNRAANAAAAKKRAAINAYVASHQVAAPPKKEETNMTALLEMDPKAALAAAKRTHGDNARFGKFMALQRKKAAYGAMQRTQEKLAKAKAEAAQPKLALVQMDPKAAMAAAKRTHGDNARFGKFMNLQRNKAANGVLASKRTHGD